MHHTCKDAMIRTWTFEARFVAFHTYYTQLDNVLQLVLCNICTWWFSSMYTIYKCEKGYAYGHNLGHINNIGGFAL